MVLILMGLAIAMFWVMRRDVSVRSLAVRQALAVAGLVVTVMLVLRGATWLSVPVAMVSVALLAQSMGRSRSDANEQESVKTAMTREQAAEVLGVSLSASESEIQSAYRQAMKSAHPDVGGSDEQAARVQKARDVLLADRER